jgi:hypothetical protein
MYMGPNESNSRSARALSRLLSSRASIVEIRATKRPSYSLIDQAKGPPIQSGIWEGTMPECLFYGHSDAIDARLESRHRGVRQQSVTIQPQHGGDLGKVLFARLAACTGERPQKHTVQHAQGRSAQARRANSSASAPPDRRIRSSPHRSSVQYARNRTDSALVRELTLSPPSVPSSLLPPRPMTTALSHALILI